jgi:hypothetical protein
VVEVLVTPARRIAITVSLVLASFAAGFGAGRATTEPVVEYRTIDLKTEDITRGFTFARTVNVTRWRNVVTTITDAGTTISDQTIEREGSSTSGIETEQVKRVEYVEREKIVTLRPDWRVSLTAGASLVTPAVPITGPLVIGASVEHRIVGPFSAGLWLNTVGAGGVVLSGEF